MKKKRLTIALALLATTISMQAQKNIKWKLACITEKVIMFQQIL